MVSTETPTETLAEADTETLADLFELVPAEPYTSDDLNWTDNNSRVEGLGL